MILYFWNPETGYFLQSKQVDDSSLIEEYSTTTPIPDYYEGYVILKINSTKDGWDLVPDYSTVNVIDSNNNFITLKPEEELPEGCKVVDYTQQDIDIMRDALWTKVKIKYSEALNVIKYPYPQDERESWFIQLEEAQKYLNDNTYKPIMLSSLLVNGETVQELAESIIHNNFIYRTIIGKITSQQRQMWYDIYTMKTPEELENYKFDFDISVYSSLGE